MFLPLLIGEQVIGVMPIWGADLRQADSPVLAIFASQVAGILQNAQAYESEARRARELAILLEASDATSSSLDLDKVLQTLAAQLLVISGFESCYISEWDKETNKVYGILDHSRVFWSKEKRDSYSLSDYPRSKEVLLTGNPIILQGDFEAKEKQWMDKLERTAAMVLALQRGRKPLGWLN